MDTLIEETQNKVDISDIKKKFGEIVRYVTLSRMRSYTNCDDFSVVELSTNNIPHGYVFANQMSMIIVAGQAVRVVFKAHFNHRDSKPLARRLYGIDEVDDARSRDVMKEYCNLTAGFLKKICIENDVPVGISLPVVTLGFNQVFSDLEGEDKKIVFDDCWKLVYADSDIICSCRVDIHNVETIQKFLQFNTEETDDDEDEFDFL